jgi:hypothetical protein
MSVIVAPALAVSVAQAEVVVVAKKSPVASMAPAQVADGYLGKDTRFAPLDLLESADERSAFYSKGAGKDATQVKAIWARLVFTGKSQPPKAVRSSAEAVKQVAGTKRALPTWTSVPSTAPSRSY